MDINEVTLMGSIKEISSIRTLKNSNQCCWLNVLTDISYKKKDGTTGHNQGNHNVIVYGKYAQVIKEKASINQKIFLQGTLKTNKGEYNNVSFQKTFIILERFKLYPSVQNESKEPERLAELKKDLENNQDNRDATQCYVGPGGMSDLSEYPEGDKGPKWNDDEDSFLRHFYETDSLDLLPTDDDDD